MPGTGECIAGGYTIYFHDQDAVKLPNQTLRTLPGSPMWSGDVLVLKNVDEDMVTHITRQDYEIVRKLLSKFVLMLCFCTLTKNSYIESLNLLNFHLLSDLLLLSILHSVVHISFHIIVVFQMFINILYN
jgi:hypothetical protein